MPMAPAVPSARFMGGREIESLIEIDTRQVDIRPDQPALLAAVPGSHRRRSNGAPHPRPRHRPLPRQHKAAGSIAPTDWFARRAGACLYAALVADAALDLIGSRECLLIEGRFAEAEVFIRALASLRPAHAVYVANAHNDVSFGALRLIDPALRPQGTLRRVDPLDTDISAYAAQWRRPPDNRTQRENTRDRTGKSRGRT